MTEDTIYGPADPAVVGQNTPSTIEPLVNLTIHLIDRVSKLADEYEVSYTQSLIPGPYTHISYAI